MKHFMALKQLSEKITTLATRSYPISHRGVPPPAATSGRVQ